MLITGPESHLAAQPDLGFRKLSRHYPWSSRWGSEDRRCQVRSEGTSPFLSSNPECRYVASSSKDGSVRVWDTAVGRCERILTGHTQSVTCLRWGGDGLLYSASQDRTIKVWRAHDVRAGRGPEPAWGNLGPGRLTTVSWLVGEVLRERGSYGLVLHYSGGSRTP